MNRENDSRLLEKCIKYIPFMPKIQTKDLAQALRLEAENLHALKKSRDSPVIYNNKQILQILKQ